MEAAVPTAFAKPIAFVPRSVRPRVVVALAVYSANDVAPGVGLPVANAKWFAVGPRDGVAVDLVKNFAEETAAVAPVGHPGAVVILTS